MSRCVFFYQTVVYRRVAYIVGLRSQSATKGDHSFARLVGSSRSPRLPTFSSEKRRPDGLVFVVVHVFVAGACLRRSQSLKRRVIARVRERRVRVSVPRRARRRFRVVQRVPAFAERLRRVRSTRGWTPRDMRRLPTAPRSVRTPALRVEVKALLNRRSFGNLRFFFCVRSRSRPPGSS